jgi:hypothetical protein
MVVSDQTTTVYRVRACVEGRRFCCIGIVLVGALFVRRWERELTEGEVIEVELVEEETAERKKVKIR